MDGGALSNVLFQLGALPEPVIANIMFQVLWGMAYLKHDRRVHRVRAQAGVTCALRA
jgi:hypothetical protein